MSTLDLRALRPFNSLDDLMIKSHLKRKEKITKIDIVNISEKYTLLRLNPKRINRMSFLNIWCSHRKGDNCFRNLKSKWNLQSAK